MEPSSAPEASSKDSLDPTSSSSERRPPACGRGRKGEDEELRRGPRRRMTAVKPTESTFLQNMVTLMSGTVVAQALPMIFSPIMTRLFSPADYGVLGVYMALTGMLTVLV